ncbi:MAG: hypothetical protein IPL39_11640 [Opitutaceae bacterium]|nr:hypothetical protein [Opitutaceae bacterium]
MTLFGRVSAEPRYWFNAASAAAEGTEWKYAIFDSLNAKWVTESDGNPVTVVLGRQDIQLGEQWLVSDGTPLDGFVDQPLRRPELSPSTPRTSRRSSTDRLQPTGLPRRCALPILGSEARAAALTEQDETGVILYASNKSVAKMQLDGYFMYKGDDRVTARGYDADIYTLGGKIAGTPAENWQYSAEAAYQWGNRRD